MGLKDTFNKTTQLGVMNIRGRDAARCPAAFLPLALLLVLVLVTAHFFSGSQTITTMRSAAAAAALLLALLIATASAFVPDNGPAPLSTRPARRPSGVTMKAAKAKKTKSKKKADEVETFKKPEFIASIADKTGFSKADSEAALAAVLDTIQEVSLGVVCCKRKFVRGSPSNFSRWKIVTHSLAQVMFPFPFWYNVPAISFCY